MRARPAVLVGVLTVVAAIAGLRDAARAGEARTREPLSAKWVWLDGQDLTAYNQTVEARKQVRLDRPVKARLRITADSFYRLFINGDWVNDGPCRAWPEHYQYDVLDVSPYLRDGDNEIRVVARYFGVGDFHRVPRQAGVLAELDVVGAGGGTTKVVTDGSWEIADRLAWVRNTPKVSVQMEPAELYDAARDDTLSFRKARVVAAADRGPWKDLNPRDCPPLTRNPFAPRAFLGAKVVKAFGLDADGLNFCLPAARLVHPGLIEANGNTSAGCGMATVLENRVGLEFGIQTEGMAVTFDGQRPQNGRVRLAPGRHLVLAFVETFFGHEKEKSLRFVDVDAPKVTLVNPIDPGHLNHWCLLRFPEYAVAASDLLWGPYIAADPKLAKARDGYNKTTSALLAAVKTLDDFKAKLAPRAECLPYEAMFVHDWHWQFINRKVVADAAELVTDPAALMHESPAVTIVRPSPKGDVELLYDLGEQNVGYYQFDLIADAGVVVDIFGIEYIAPDGQLQHTYGNRNGLRYVTKEGVNRFTSLKRRSGRYLFVTLRNQKAPVSIRNLRLIESTYPVNRIGSFQCSDARLERIWDISTRTLKLCMEDTFTDCPLYEQTHWVGDARNESMLAYPVYGSTDLARRCIGITAQSLERYPIAGCQTPSGWDVLIPAWSFLWGISVWDYYWYTGDLDTLRAYRPAMLRNIEGAEKLVNDRDLFSAPYWNFFDWTGIDAGQRVVLHNSLFFVGAIDAALKAGAALDDHERDAWLRALRHRLVRGINRLWDDKKGAYPDSVRDDGSLSPSTCQHTSFLAVLFDVLDPKNIEVAKRNLLSPPEGMVRVGSPFAALYLYEALEKLGRDDAIIREIYRNYMPMVDAGATTVWESFASGTTGGGRFPTRSHCHAWSSAPNYFLPRIVLGIRPVEPASRSVQISPRPAGLSWARGTVATTRGPIKVSWELKDRTLTITCDAPPDVRVAFVRNDSLAGHRVVFNGKPID
jgi:alpha-L-rhamnosidase